MCVDQEMLEWEEIEYIPASMGKKGNRQANSATPIEPVGGKTRKGKVDWWKWVQRLVWGIAIFGGCYGLTKHVLNDETNQLRTEQKTQGIRLDGFDKHLDGLDKRFDGIDESLRVINAQLFNLAIRPIAIKNPREITKQDLDAIAMNVKQSVKFGTTPDVTLVRMIANTSMSVARQNPELRQDALQAASEAIALGSRIDLMESGDGAFIGRGEPVSCKLSADGARLVLVGPCDQPLDGFLFKDVIFWGFRRR